MQALIINLTLSLTRSIQKNISLVFTSLIFPLFFCPLNAGDLPKLSLPIVVISQIIQHASLDQEREGLTAALKEAGSVERVALAAYAYERGTLGRQAGALIVKILNGQKAGDLKVETDHPLVLMINLKSAEEMGVAISGDLKNQAKMIGDKR